MFYKRESHMWQISVIDLLNAGEIWTRSISCGVSEGRGRGTNKKKEDITTSEVYLFMQRCSSLYDAVFRRWWCINSSLIFMYFGEYHIWSSKPSFEEFFFSAFSAGLISHVDTPSRSPEEWTCRRVSAWDLTSQAFQWVSLLKSINWLLR